jgi:hypothetical protein
MIQWLLRKWKRGNCDISQHRSINININMMIFPRDNHYILINDKIILICSFMKFYISEDITLQLEALLWEHFMTQYASELICMSNICATAQPTMMMLTHRLSTMLCCTDTWIWSCHMLLSLRINSDLLWWLRPVSSQLTFKGLKWIWWPDFCSDHLHSAKTWQGIQLAQALPVWASTLYTYPHKHVNRYRNQI